jgi:hypothetical protein
VAEVDENGLKSLHRSLGESFGVSQVAGQLHVEAAALDQLQQTGLGPRAPLLLFALVTTLHRRAYNRVWKLTVENGSNWPLATRHPPPLPCPILVFNS